MKSKKISSESLMLSHLHWMYANKALSTSFQEWFLFPSQVFLNLWSNERWGAPVRILLKSKDTTALEKHLNLVRKSFLNKCQLCKSTLRELDSCFIQSNLLEYADVLHVPQKPIIYWILFQKWSQHLVQLQMQIQLFQAINRETGREEKLFRKDSTYSVSGSTMT